MTTDIGQGYDAFYTGLRRSPTLQRIWREHALGAAYPNGFEHISFLTVSELRRLAAALAFEISATLDRQVIRRRVFVVASRSFGTDVTGTHGFVHRLKTKSRRR